jgi:hypothetical protein
MSQPGNLAVQAIDTSQRSYAVFKVLASGVDEEHTLFLQYNF